MENPEDVRFVAETAKEYSAVDFAESLRFRI
jgi:hypothetical protein